MIQITAYLRTEEDHNKWKAIPNKTEFMHVCLERAYIAGELVNNLDAYDLAKKGAYGEAKRRSESVDSAATVVIGTARTIRPVETPAVDGGRLIYTSIITDKRCKHGYDPMFCKYAKNGKACK